MTDKVDETTVAGNAMIAGDAHGPDNKIKKITPKNPDGYFAGCPVFDVDETKFMQARMGRQKGQRWFTFLGANCEWAAGVRAWARQNGNADFLLKNTADGTYMYAQKGMKK